MNSRFLSSIRFRAVSGMALFCVGGLTAFGHAASQKVVGDSPTAYSSPLTNAQKELQAFQDLIQSRETGRISQQEYQTKLLQLAAEDKQGVRFNDSGPVTPIDPIVLLPTPRTLPTPPNPSLATTPKSSIGARLLLPSSPIKNKMGGIERPGPIRSVVTKEVPSL